MTAESLEARATKARKAIYLATEQAVAQDIDNIIGALLGRIAALEAVIQDIYNALEESGWHFTAAELKARAEAALNPARPRSGPVEE